MDDITKARHNFVLAFQYCWNGTEFPVFRDIRVSENEGIHTGFFAIDLLDEALDLHPDFQEARDLRADIWHAILTKNREDHYEKYLHSEAWTEIREKCFAHFGCKCLFCGNDATDVHHRNYDRIGKENVLTDLSALCDECHQRYHEPENPSPLRIAYWDQFRTYVEEKGNRLQLFPEPATNEIYSIQIDPKNPTSAFWLVAYRPTRELQANLYMQSADHYSLLKKQKDDIEREFNPNLGELRWVDSGNAKRIGFMDDTVGPVNEANRDMEFSWLHDRLIRLQEVFRPRVSELQISSKGVSDGQT